VRPQDELPNRRRRHSDEFKAQVVAECARPGVSMAAIALHYGINANLLRRWVVQACQEESRTPHGRLDRNWLKGELGDAQHAVLCGAGHNIRLLIRKLRLLFARLASALLGALSLPVNSMALD
jgi:hypothetical protein